MIKPKFLKKGDKIAIVSLSRGLLGMPFCKHELDIALKRIEEFGLVPVLMPNALIIDNISSLFDLSFLCSFIIFLIFNNNSPL